MVLQSSSSSSSSSTLIDAFIFVFIRTLMTLTVNFCFCLHNHFTFKLLFTCLFFCHAIQFDDLEYGFTKDPHAVFLSLLVWLVLSFHFHHHVQVNPRSAALCQGQIVCAKQLMFVLHLRKASDSLCISSGCLVQALLITLPLPQLFGLSL